MVKKNFSFKNDEIIRIIFGEKDKNIDLLEELLEIKIFPKGTDVQIEGTKKNIETAEKTLSKLQEVSMREVDLDAKHLIMVANSIKEGTEDTIQELFFQPIGRNRKNQNILPKTNNQKKYVQLIEKHDVTFAWGPAGTGKTYLATVLAVKALEQKKIQKIILTRPAVEAGEKLGFLPGDLTEKVNPYLRPLLDSIQDLVDSDKLRSWIEKEIVEIAPLAFMRGRTLNNSFIILDEAQNTTSSQMKMFLTRLGKHSKAVINGDITQIDLPLNQSSGLVEALHILQKISQIGFVELQSKDVVRHPLVAKIIDAYEKNSK